MPWRRGLRRGGSSPGVGRCGLRRGGSSPGVGRCTRRTDRAVAATHPAPRRSSRGLRGRGRACSRQRRMWRFFVALSHQEEEVRRRPCELRVVGQSCGFYRSVARAPFVPPLVALVAMALSRPRSPLHSTAGPSRKPPDCCYFARAGALVTSAGAPQVGTREQDKAVASLPGQPAATTPVQQQQPRHSVDSLPAAPCAAHSAWKQLA